MIALCGMPTSHDLRLRVARGSGWRRSRSPTCDGSSCASSSTGRRSSAVLFIYDLLRGVADGLLVHAREMPQIKRRGGALREAGPDGLAAGAPLARAERPALVGLRDVVRLPDALLRDVHRRGRRSGPGRTTTSSRAYATMVCVLALTGFATYVLYPAVPPWMAAQHGQPRRVEPDDRLVWHHIPFTHAGSRLRARQGLREQRRGDAVAARRVRAARRLFLWRLVPRWWRPLLALYPLAMAFALVYSGEHYIVDCVAGWAYAAFAFFVGQVRVRAARRSGARASIRRWSIERVAPAALLRRHRRG